MLGTWHSVSKSKKVPRGVDRFWGRCSCKGGILWLRTYAGRGPDASGPVPGHPCPGHTRPSRGFCPLSRRLLQAGPGGPVTLYSAGCIRSKGGPAKFRRLSSLGGGRHGLCLRHFWGCSNPGMPRASYSMLRNRLFRAFPVAVQPKFSPEGRFPARNQYCVTESRTAIRVHPGPGSG
jgi:hypothetical protein